MTNAFLVGLQKERKNSETEGTNHMLNELEELLNTLGIETVGLLEVYLPNPRPRYLVGSGKAREIIELARQNNADIIVFDDPLTPAQQRNWEKLADLTVIDRQEIILDIFAQRAHTKEAELQISLARAKYELPRLKRRWTHLSRQRGTSGGGTAVRGEGEQQIEVDARLVKKRISQLQKQLEQVKRKRRVQRKKRSQRPLPNCTIVGYTNAGKSTVLNRLTGASIFTENKLFATLDPTTRRLTLPNRQELLISDTVGFIRKLPHLLVESFKATLEEAAIAGFIVEVIDISNPDIHEHHQTTLEVLRELNADDKPIITVFNKIDLLEDQTVIPRLRKRFRQPVFVSAATGHGFSELKQRLAAELENELVKITLIIPHSRYEIMAMLHRTSEILRKNTTDKGIEVEAAVPFDLVPKFREFQLSGN